MTRVSVPCPPGQSDGTKSPLHDHLKAFERELDAAFAQLEVQGCDADGALGLSANMHENAACDRAHWQASGLFDRAITILAGRLVSGHSGAEPEIGQLFADLMFASHYYMLREYLYYAYNVPGSMVWTFAADRVDVRFADPTIPRQFFTVHNDTVLRSRDIFEGFDVHSAEIRRLLKGEPEGIATPRVLEAHGLIALEVEIKLRSYFSILPDNAAIDLGGYTYSQFVAFYRCLLEKALYHRYMAAENEAVGAIFIDPADLVAAAKKEPGLSENVTRAILADIVFDGAASKTRLDASYFSLFREGGSRGRIVMRPHHFAIAEGLVNLLRVVAQRRPKTFLDKVSNALGSGFVRRVKAAWEAQGFACRAEVSLRAYDPTLPDIDLLVISEEPTLGYVVFVCELKSPIPPRWAKDQLKVLNSDSVSKAFRQAAAISAFLGTDAGIAFLGSMLPAEGIAHFDGFVVAVESLIITSDNGGMFFGDENTPIMNFRTLERLLIRSDGDMAFIQNVIRTYDDVADQHVNTNVAEFQMGVRTVSYEGVSSSSLLDFPQQSWRTSPERQAMIDAFIADGAHPFDVFPERPAFPDGRPVHLSTIRTRRGGALKPDPDD